MRLSVRQQRRQVRRQIIDLTAKNAPERVHFLFEAARLNLYVKSSCLYPAVFCKAVFCKRQELPEAARLSEAES